MPIRGGGSDANPAETSEEQHRDGEESRVVQGLLGSPSLESIKAKTSDS